MRAGWFVAAALWFAGVWFAGGAGAQPILLSGTIGKAPVFLDLDRTGDTVSGGKTAPKALVSIEPLPAVLSMAKPAPNINPKI